MPAYGHSCLPAAESSQDLIFHRPCATIAVLFSVRTIILGQNTLKQFVVKESALLLGLLFLGFIIMPIAIYWVGQDVLGEFGGHGYADFFGSLSAKIRSGDLVAWFFVLSPYLAWQTLRLTLFAWRATGKASS